MTILFENETGGTLDLDLEQIAEEVINASLDITGCPYEAQVSLLVTDDDTIRNMNSEFRGLDKATDVLSFPMLEFDNPGDFSFLEDDSAFSDCFDPETGELILGDIVISADHVLSQAKEYGHSIKREYAFLIAHSMMHLAGYDHMQPEDEKEMFSLQNEILDHLGIRR